LERTDADDAPAKKPTSGRSGNACARAVSGHVMAEPAITLKKSRRRIAFPKALDHDNCIDDYSRDLRPAKRASIVILQTATLSPGCPLWWRG
jgi:hypothetical protein